MKSDKFPKNDRISRRIGFCFKWAVIFLLAGNSPVWAGLNSILAYIDPGSGSFILQMLLAGLVGAAFAIKMFWRQIKAFFVNLFSKKRNPNDRG